MKKYFVFICILAVLIGCAKEEQLFEKPIAEESEEQAPALTFNFSINHSSLDNPTTKAVKSGWEAGDKVFVFFSTVATPKHLELTFDGTDWTATEMNGKNPGSLGLTEDGTMTAVYLPFGNDAIVKTKSGRFAFDQTDYAYYLSCVNVPYTVSGAVVSGTLDMNVPDGFVQFFFVDADAEDGNALLREAHVTPKAVTGVNADGTLVIESKAEGTQMPGFVYGEGAAKGYLFSGELADAARGVSTAYHFNMVRGAVSKVLEGTKTLYNGTAGNYTQRAIKFPAISVWAAGDDEIIEFADANIKTKVVEAFDTSGDGELSFSEAAAATSISGIFGDATNYFSFDEFRFFTGIGEIPNNQFKNWIQLKSISLPINVQSIGWAAFYGCSSLVSLVIPDNVSSIDCYSFYGCSHLVSITLPSNITRIRQSSFENCVSLTKIMIPEGVTKIESSVFEGCSGLTSISIPSSVNIIGFNAFYNCTSVKHLYVENLDSWISTDIEGQGAGSHPLQSTLQPAHIYVSGEEVINLVIPDNVTSIPHDAFHNCSYITSIILPESLISIGSSAFCGLSSLASIEFPDSIQNIGSSAFANCNALSAIVIPEQVSLINRSVFSNCTGLTSVELPDGIVSVGDYAFENCSSLASIDLPEGVLTIGSSAFNNCTSLTSFVFPESILSIGGSALFNCQGLQAITIYAHDVPTGGNYMFYCYNNNYPIYVPADAIDDYKAAAYWSTYADRIQAIP